MSTFGRERRTFKAMSALPSIDHLYPYVVPSGHVQQIPADQPSWPLGPDTAVVLVWDIDGVGRGVSLSDLAASGLSRDEGFDHAVENLMLAVRTRDIQTRELAGPDGSPAVLLVSGHWLSATTLLIPSLYLRAASLLGTPKILASIPERGVLLAFAEGDASSREAWRSRVRKAISEAERPITDRFFRLTPDGPEPFDEMTDLIFSATDAVRRREAVVA